MKLASSCTHVLCLPLLAIVFCTAVCMPVQAAAPASVEARLAALEAKAAAPAINTGDNAWLLVSSALVLMMTAPGLVLFYGGLVRSRMCWGP